MFLAGCAKEGRDGENPAPVIVINQTEEWSPYTNLPLWEPPPSTKGELFDKVHSNMTLGELVALVGHGWMRVQYEGCGIIRWTCEDGRELCVCPVTYRQEEIIEVGPRQIPGYGGRGRMWMTRLVKDREVIDIAIPLK